MELINNTTKTLKDDLSVEIRQGSKLSIAAACFSIYAFQELKEQLSQIEQLRFIFTSPTFVTEKAKKERREFYIPRLTRERSLYGTEFEIKLRNELTQKAIARECAEWIRQKVTFKSNVSDKSIQGQIVVDSVSSTQEFIHLAAQHIDNADMLNKRYAPFIAKEIFESYKELGRQAYSIISLLDLWSRFETQNYIINYNGTAYTRDKAKDEIETKQKIISKLSDDILDKLRDYLSSLDTLEDKVNG